MNRLYLIVISFFILKIASSQIISPVQTDEYCPNVEYTFTATISKTYQSMTGVGGCYVTQLPTQPVGSTFTFKGKFADANQKQSFRIYYSDGTSYDFEFKKIKSLFFNNPNSQSCPGIQPNQTSITAPRCQITNFNISFSNIQWSTFGESPDYCFGAITTYEYQLPNGWSIGSNVSTGTNWIASGNNVTITSDLSNGVNGVILIRPGNACGTGLQNGQTPAQIPIFRPAPSFSISSTQDYICSGSVDFTLNGMPAGSTVQWSVSDQSLAQITAGSTSPTVTVTKVGGNGEITLTATVTHCSFIYSVPKTVAVGAGAPPLITNLNYDQSCGTFMEAYSSNPGSATGYIWNLNFGQVVQNSDGYGSDYFYVKPLINSPQAGQSYYNYISVQAKNACGVSDPSETRQFTVGPVPSTCGQNGGTCETGCTKCCPILLIAPNPTTSSLVIQVTDGTEFTRVRIIDKMGNMKKEFGTISTKRATINVQELSSDIYRIQVYNGKRWVTGTFIKQ